MTSYFNRSKLNILGAILTLLAAGLLYLLTLDNGLRPDELVGGDLITHQYAQMQARPSNAPGYPLYTMGGWLWFRVGRALLQWALNPIEILSFYSTLWGLASLGVLYLVLLRVLDARREVGKPLQFGSGEAQDRLRGTGGNSGLLAGHHWLVALLLTAFYAATFFFWYYSVTTEQYTSAVFQTLLIIWLAFKWDASPRHSTLLGLAFISGTMLANMVTTFFILPPLLWFIFSKKTSSGLILFHYLERPKLVAQAVGVALLPLLSYAYIYIRGAQHPEWRGAGEWPSTWAWFAQFITIQQGRDELAPGLSLQTIFTNEFPALMWQELTWPIFFGGLIGLAALGRRRAIFLYGALAFYFLFSWGYRFGNWFQVIIPAYPIFIIGSAAGLRWTSGWVAKNIQHFSFITCHKMPFGYSSRIPALRAGARVTHALWSSVVLLFLAGLFVYRFNTNLPRADQQDLSADTGLRPGWLIIADNPDAPAAVISDFEERVALEYLRAAWGIAPELTPVDPANLQPVESIQSRQYISRRAAAIAPKFTQGPNVYPQAAGQQLIELQTTPRRRLPATAHPAQLNFGDALALAGWEQVNPKVDLPPDATAHVAPANWQFALYWQSLETLEVDYTVSVRPLVGGQLIRQGEEPVIQDHQPVWGVYPTSRWPPGHLVRDVYALALPPGAAPEAVQIVVYRATEAGFENLGEKIIVLVE